MSVTFRDVKADLLRKITLGELAPGGTVPNEIDLAADYGCARATVNRAMRELVDDGIIERRRKAGTRVRVAPVRNARFSIPLVREEIESQGSEYGYSLVARSVTKPPDWLVTQLSLATKDLVLHLICMHYADGEPYQHEDRWINLKVTPKAESTDFTAVGPNEWLVKAIPFSNAEISFQAVQADAKLADHLGCKAGDALFRTERSTWWNGDAVTFVRLTHRPMHRITTQY